MMGVPFDALRMVRRTTSRNFGRSFTPGLNAPHARTTAPAFTQLASMWCAFAGPSTSSPRFHAALRSTGDVARNANRFTTTSAENPHARANPMQRRIVGSSCIASAVLGLSITNVTCCPLPALIGSPTHERVRR